MQKGDRRRNLLPLWFLLAAGVLSFGLWRGEADIVLRKAIRVCLECIGIG